MDLTTAAADAASAAFPAWSATGPNGRRALLNKAAEALEARSEQLQLEFLKMFSDALPHLPLYYSPEVLVVKKGLTGITPRQESGGQNSSSWNMQQWDKS